MRKLVKIENLLPKIKQALELGNYIFTGHANERLQQREVTRPEVRQVLQSGFHEKEKDKYDNTFEAWNYSVTGRTID